MATLSRQHNHHSKSSAWRIIGIDPGSVVTGWGVIEARGTALTHVGHGTIGTADARAQGDRLSCIYLGIQEAIKSYRPDGLSLERVFLRVMHKAPSNSARPVGWRFLLPLMPASRCMNMPHQRSNLRWWVTDRRPRIRCKRWWLRSSGFPG